MRHVPSLDPQRFPIDPWRLVDLDPFSDDLGAAETLFSLGNGYLGIRDNPPEGEPAHTHGTFINGFHETWEIHHAESAHAFARVGQTIVNVPDAKLMRIHVDNQPAPTDQVDLDHHDRILDFKEGNHRRTMVWRTPAGHRVSMTATRIISMEDRHLALFRMELQMLEGRAHIAVNSEILNREDGTGGSLSEETAAGEELDPRQARRFDQRVLVPDAQSNQPELGNGGEIALGHRTATSGMRIATACRHMVTGDVEPTTTTLVQPDHAEVALSFNLDVGQKVTIDKWVTYHTSADAHCEELISRCHQTLSRSIAAGPDRLFSSQREWMSRFWSATDVVIEGDHRAQQSVRWNLFQLAQATAACDNSGVAAKGVSAAGYDGHYFWDTEIYVVPFLARTDPASARELLVFRHGLLDAARRRAAELSQIGALYPWRTINGEEASAYYPAGTAQYHINAAVAYAIEQYMKATGDQEFLLHEGVEILIETARLWHDLGFIGRDGAFHIHQVTGPDEYTAVVNDNFYTNVMARFNLRYAASVLRECARGDSDAFTLLRARTGVTLEEADNWESAADLMYLPFDEQLGIHPQDGTFLDLEPWDFDGTPDDCYPLLLNFHPLVIYRHQVLKQADVVLAMYLRGEHFDIDQKRRNFDFYDPITTGDSSLSACVQSIAASEIGRHDLALTYFEQALFLDLANTHQNTADGVHIANAGGVWAALVHGFGGVRFTDVGLTIEPALPPQWTSLSIGFLLRESACRLDVNHSRWTVSVIRGPDVTVEFRGESHPVTVGESFTSS